MADTEDRGVEFLVEEEDKGDSRVEKKMMKAANLFDDNE